MPEGPTVRRFCSLVSPFVGQGVVSVSGSTRQIALQDLKEQLFQDCQVHGKNLYLAFGCGIMEQVPSHELDDWESDGSHGEKSLKDWSLSEGTADVSDDQRNLGTGQGNLLRKWLRFHFGLYGSVRANELSRAKQGNKRGDWRDPKPRLRLNFDGERFLVFYNCRMTWCSSPFVEPTCDILSPEFDKEKALHALSHPRPVCFTLMDQRHFSGVGNIIKNEILFLAQTHPLSLGSLLPAETLVALIDHAIAFTADWLRNKMQRKGLRYHIYMKECCGKGHQVVKEAIGPPHGLKRLTWYCPTCQKHVNPGEAEQPIVQ
ncbi:LOW QUALITY PROTEIN: endonuclease 8-like 2 [Mixophyes fleayi]|uniref:LOW QUALITY PROTEIN: endonuclease 8-like 2 n=1 Tax=Mixophyes fleayi TaxID=3061075 RepID=UPI003F4DAB89